MSAIVRVNFFPVCCILESQRKLNAVLTILFLETLILYMNPRFVATNKNFASLLSTMHRTDSCFCLAKPGESRSNNWIQLTTWRKQLVLTFMERVETVCLASGKSYANSWYPLCARERLKEFNCLCKLQSFIPASPPPDTNNLNFVSKVKGKSGIFLQK